MVVFPRMIDFAKPDVDMPIPPHRTGLLPKPPIKPNPEHKPIPKPGPKPVITPKPEPTKVTTVKSGLTIDPELEKKADDILKRKYGVTLEELKRIVETSKDQPEAIHRLRMMLHGSERYDPKYHELENLVSQLHQLKEFGYIPEVPERVRRVIRSVVVRHTPRARVENGKIVVRKPVPHRLPEEVTRNTGIKTVPKPQPKPSVVARKVSITSTTPKPQSATVHISQAKSTDYRKLGMYALGAVVAFLVLKKILR